MKTLFCVSVVSALLLLAAPESHAGAPTCHTHQHGSYCAYDGTVKSLYINSGNQILMYFDTPMDPSAPTGAGISGVSYYTATIYHLPDNYEYGKLLYATLLAAQSRGATVSIQMRGTYSGYMVVDRIWLPE